MADEFDEQAERLLPCSVYCGEIHEVACPVLYRPTVAAALREINNALLLCQGELELSFTEQDELRQQVQRLEADVAQYQAGHEELAQANQELRREVERLQAIIIAIEPQLLRLVDELEKLQQSNLASKKILDK